MKSRLKIINIFLTLSIVLLTIFLASCQCDVDSDETLEVNQWTSLGPEGGDVSVLVIDPVNTDTLYAGTGGGVFKSTDGGTKLSLFQLQRFEPNTLTNETLQASGIPTYEIRESSGSMIFFAFIP